MMELSVDWKRGSPATSATAGPEPSGIAELRATILAIDYREEALEQYRPRLDQALDALIAESRGRGEHVEALIVRIKHLCAEPQLTDVHRLKRTWLVTEVVALCIRRYFAALG